jgi:hypothetical protein
VIRPSPPRRTGDRPRALLPARRVPLKPGNLLPSRALHLPTRRASPLCLVIANPRHVARPPRFPRRPARPAAENEAPPARPPPR